MKYKVKAPVENYNGISAGVQFADGLGETDDDHIAKWFEQKGYTVSKEKKPKATKGGKEDA